MTIREQVSGIGAQAKRTDLNVSKQPARYISGLPQGQGQATYNQQTAAPMMDAGTNSAALPDIISLTAPTQRPDEPISSGVDFGAGPNSNVIKLPNSEPTLLTVLQQIAENDPSGETELIYQALLERGF